MKKATKQCCKQTGNRNKSGNRASKKKHVIRRSEQTPSYYVITLPGSMTDIPEGHGSCRQASSLLSSP